MNKTLQVEVALQNLLQDKDIDPVAISAETWQSWFQTWLESLQPDLSPIAAYELSLRLTTDTDIQELNRDYRGKDQATDVLAFAELDLEETLPDEMQTTQPYYLGDLVISVETAQRQAIAQGHSLQDEVAWLATHGLLHLLGWDHPDDESLERMLNQQQHLLNSTHTGLQLI